MFVDIDDDDFSCIDEMSIADSVNDSLNSSLTQTSLVDVEPESHPAVPLVAVVGDSMTRGLAPQISWGGDFTATGYNYGGLTARQINGNIRNISDVSTSDVTVLFAGTNNALSQSLGQAKDELNQLIDNVSRKRKGKHVIMFTVPYNLKRPQLNFKIDQINNYLENQIGLRKNWHLIDIELCNDDYRLDGLHMNAQGIAKRALEVRSFIRKLNLA